MKQRCGIDGEMQVVFHNSSAEVFVPDGSAEDVALARTTHLGIGAHPDDLEIIALHGIVECYGIADKHFTGITVTDGAGSSRVGPYAGYTDEQMRAVRREEQKKAAALGQYSAQVLLDYPSSAVKDAANTEVVEDLIRIIDAARPRVVYTHNPADKHATHVAVALRVIEAIRRLPRQSRPKMLYGCEAWRDLDWLADGDKVVFDVGAHEELAVALMRVFDSQITGGKRYDLAASGRRRANATFCKSHEPDFSTGLIYAINLTPLVADETLDVGEYVGGFVQQFAADVTGAIRRLSC